MAKTKAEKLGLPPDSEIHDVSCEECGAKNHLTADPSFAGDDVYTTRTVVDEETNTSTQVQDLDRVTLWECNECGSKNTIKMNIEEGAR